MITENADRVSDYCSFTLDYYYVKSFRPHETHVHVAKRHCPSSCQDIHVLLRANDLSSEANQSQLTNRAMFQVTDANYTL
jgi:hypothetical protein